MFTISSFHPILYLETIISSQYPSAELSVYTWQNRLFLADQVQRLIRLPAMTHLLRLLCAESEEIHS